MASSQMWLFCFRNYLLLTLVLVSSGHNIQKRGEPLSRGKQESLTLTMPGAEPSGHDSYLCTAFKVSKLTGSKEKIFVTGFQPENAVADKAHHMMLHTCTNPPKGRDIWDCRHHQTCQGQSGVMYAWAKNAPGAEMPDDVGFEIDPATSPYLILQVHYVKELAEKDDTGLKLQFQRTPTRYMAGIYLLLRSYLNIPAQTPKVHGDVNCQVNLQSPIHPFAFRTHAHSLGAVITGYQYKTETKEYVEIARGNPQWPQSFYPMLKNVTINQGDFLAARCTYDTTGIEKNTRIGATAGDEMCNLYLMYYTESGSAGYQSCVNEQTPVITSHLPADSDEPPPKNPLLEEHAKHRKAHLKKGELESLVSSSMKSMNRKKDLDNPEPNPLDLADQTHQETFEIKMPGSEPKNKDDYFCTAFSINKLAGGRKKIFVTGFEALASADKAHHLIVQKCNMPVKNEGEIWSCQHHATCRSSGKIMYAWAKDAPPTILPPDVGFKLEDSDGYIVLQVHYAHGLEEKDYTGLRMTFTEDEPANTAGIHLMLRSYLNIPARTEVVHGDMNCAVNRPMTLFAFRTHAHQYGRVITGYVVKDGDFTEIARGDPQKPQTFYPMETFVQVQKGDYLAARCTFDSTSSDHDIKIGSTAGDEMCNLYLMYYSPSERDDFGVCADQAIPSLSRLFPEDSDVQIKDLPSWRESHSSTAHAELPISYSNSLLEQESNGEFVPNKMKKQGYGRVSPNISPRQIYVPPPPPPVQPQYNPYGGGGGYYQQQQQQPQPIYQQPSQQYPMYNNYGPPPPQVQQPSYYGPPLQQQQEYNGPELEQGYQEEEKEEASSTESSSAATKPAGAGEKTSAKPWRKKIPLKSIHGATGDDRPGMNSGSALYSVPNWPPKETAAYIGQVSGVALDSYNNPVIFHRGDRTWNRDTFGFNNVYSGDRNQPIEANTVLTLDKDSGKISNAWGSRKFFLPHMITIDAQNNIWLTDVALHQVFKYGPYGGKGDALIALGRKFEPGSDDVHYCKPTSVAVESSGDTFYVADGYCNSRIIKYTVSVNKEGYHNVSKIMQWGVSDGSGISISRSPYAFNIPHALTLAEELNILCVADRENGRIQCLNKEDGKLVHSIQPKELGSTVYSVAYSPSEGGQIFAVCGPETFGVISGKRTQGYIIDINSGKVKETFNADGKGFQNPHDVAVTKDGSIVYEVELNPFKVWKLTATAQGGPPKVLPTFPAVPESSQNGADQSKQQNTQNGFQNMGKLGLEKIEKIIPTSTFGVSLAICSVGLTCFLTLCLTWRKCKKRGKRSMKSSTSKKGDGKLDLGDFLGRSKEGFQPLKQDDDDEAPTLSSDSDDLEEFSVPALRA